MIGAGDQLVKVQRGAAEAEFIVSSNTRLLDLGSALFSTDEFKLAFSATTPTLVLLELETGDMLTVANVLSEAGEEVTIGELGKFKLVCKDENFEPQLVRVNVRSAAMEMMGTIGVLPTASANDVILQLATQFSGRLAQSKLVYAGKQLGAQRELASAFTSDVGAVLLERVELAICKLVPILRPAVPSCMSELEVVLAAGVGVLAEEVTHAGGEGGDEQSALQETEMRTLRAQIATSCTKWSADQEQTLWAAGLTEDDPSACYAVFRKETVATKPRTGLSSSQEKVRFDCTLCKDSTRNKDTAHGGTLRHTCSDTHLKNLLMQQGTHVEGGASAAATALALKLPKCYTKLRKLNSTQHKATEQAKATKARVGAATAILTGQAPMHQATMPPSPVAFRGLSPGDMGAAIADGI